MIILKVQLPRGFWNSKGGIEFPLSLAGGLLGILLIGPGGFSIDGLLHLGLMSEAWVKWIGVIAGIAGGIAIYLYSVRPSVRRLADAYARRSIRSRTESSTGLGAHGASYT